MSIIQHHKKKKNDGEINDIAHHLLYNDFSIIEKYNSIVAMERRLDNVRLSTAEEQFARPRP